MSFQPRSSIEQLLAEPHRYGFFQAVRLLERWFAQRDGLSSEQVLAQRLRFHNSLSLAFPPSEIAALKAVLAERPEGQPEAELDSQAQTPPQIHSIDITPAFIGLLGAGGALPSFYTELFAAREQLDRDSSAKAFLDIFQHRIVVLFYRAWRKHRLALQFEAQRREQFLPIVLSLAGLGSRGLHHRLGAAQGGVADESLAFYAGALRHRPVAAGQMRRVLAQYFGVPVQLDSFVGRWFALPQRNQCTLGMNNATLGQGAVVGERIWQRDLRVRLTLGPMNHARFKRFLPGGPGALALRELLTLMTGTTLEYEVRLSLAASDVQPAQLSATQGPRLGWNSFLITQPAANDRLDAGYDIHAAA